MIFKGVIFSFLLIVFSGSIFGANLFSCEFKPEGTCDSHQVSVLYAVDDVEYKDSNSLVSSSSVQYILYDYPQMELCCGIDPTKDIAPVTFTFEDTSSTSCSTLGDDDIFYLTSNENGRVGFRETNFGIENPNFVLEEYSKKLCVGIPEEFSGFDIVVSEDDKYKTAGYECLFKISDLESGIISDCDATLAYDEGFYFVWAKLVENIASLKCSSDCRSLLDDRVYSNCGLKLTSCRNVPLACDGAVYDSWVYSELADADVRCSAPWTQKRYRMFTQTSLQVEFEEDNCDNVIEKSYPVVLDNEQVIMKVYMCE